MVAPLNIARGTQNKILEAMALGVPVVDEPRWRPAAWTLSRPSILVADTPAATAEAVLRMLERSAPSGRGSAQAGRERMLSHHAWEPLDAAAGRHHRALARAARALAQPERNDGQLA